MRLTQPPRRGECGSGVNHQVAFLNSFLSFLVVSTNPQKREYSFHSQYTSPEETGQRT